MANVEKNAVFKSIVLCKKTIEQYKQTSQYLKKQYLNAGTTWRDQKYNQLGLVLKDCTAAMHSPVKELEECVYSLNEILRAIEKYEKENL